jgi:hypothetical protein
MDYLKKFMETGEGPTITVEIEKKSIINLVVGLIIAVVIIILIYRISTPKN